VYIYLEYANKKKKKGYINGRKSDDMVVKSDIVIKVRYIRRARGYFLELIVKFKEAGKFFRTKLVKNICYMYTDDFDILINDRTDFEKFFNDCIDFLENYYTIRKEAINMVREYFEQKYKKHDDKLIRQLVKEVNKKNIKISKNEVNL
jgi:hypothetical protein